MTDLSFENSIRPNLYCGSQVEIKIISFPAAL